MNAILNYNIENLNIWRQTSVKFIIEEYKQPAMFRLYFCYEQGLINLQIMSIKN